MVLHLLSPNYIGKEENVKEKRINLLDRAYKLVLSHKD